MNSGKMVLAIGIVALIIGIISRVILKPIPPMGLEAGAVLQFANTCFLLAIALSLQQCKK